VEVQGFRKKLSMSNVKPREQMAHVVGSSDTGIWCWFSSGSDYVLREKSDWNFIKDNAYRFLWTQAAAAKEVVE
jgi:hypothetical protein